MVLGAKLIILRSILRHWERLFKPAVYAVLIISFYTNQVTIVSYWTGQLQGGLRGLATSQTGLKFEIVFELLYKGPEFSAFYFSQKYQCEIRHSRSVNIAPDHQGQRISPTSKYVEQNDVLALPVQLGHNDVLSLASAGSSWKVDVDWKKSERKKKKNDFIFNSEQWWIRNFTLPFESRFK